jgi:hypothetical protein
MLSMHEGSCGGTPFEKARQPKRFGDFATFELSKWNAVNYKRCGMKMNGVDECGMKQICEEKSTAIEWVLVLILFCCKGDH